MENAYGIHSTIRFVRGNINSNVNYNRGEKQSKLGFLALKQRF